MFAEPAVVRGCYTTPPPPGSPAQRSGGAGRWCCRGAGPAGGSRQPAPPRLGRGATLGSHKLCNTRLSLLYGCEKERRVLGSPGGSGGAGVFLAVPNRLGSGTANLLTHMSLLPWDSLGKGEGARHSRHTLPLAQSPHAGRHCVM